MELMGITRYHTEPKVTQGGNEQHGTIIRVADSSSSGNAYHLLGRIRSRRRLRDWTSKNAADSAAFFIFLLTKISTWYKISIRY